MLSPLCYVAPRCPELPQGPRQAQANLDVTRLQRASGALVPGGSFCPDQGRSQIIMLSLEPLEPDHLTRALQLGLGTLREGAVVGCMLAREPRPLLPRQLFRRVLAESLQQTVPHLRWMRGEGRGLGGFLCQHE